jgi:membrane associated rhomboid family serine protease
VNSVLEDIRECPGTIGLASSWILIFALSHFVQWQAPPNALPGSMVGPLPVSMATAHRFGDMTWSEVRHGEAWRLVTATFVHYSLLHLGMNVLSLIMLGRLVEPWYGPGPFLGVCLAIGGFGNLTGGLLRQLVAMARPWVVSTGVGRHWPGLYDRFFHVGPAGPVNVPSGGGSTIVLGLIGLAAVVGWRSRTRIGAYLSRQMVALLVFTAILGVVFYSLIDNYGHAGGAIVGAAIGFVHRPLIRLSERGPIRRLSWFAVGAVLLACLTAAVRDDRAERNVAIRLLHVIQRGQATEQTLNDLSRLYTFHGQKILGSPEYRDPFNELDALAVADLLSRGRRDPALTVPSKLEPEQVARERAEVEAVLDRLDRLPAATLWGEAVADDLERLRVLGRDALETTPRYAQGYDFVVSYQAAFKVLDADLARLKSELNELSRLVQAVR